MTCEIANVMTETPIITAAIPISRRMRNARKRTLPRAYLLMAANSSQPIGFHAKPFTFERSPKFSVGW